jgi:hypothetical protein
MQLNAHRCENYTIPSLAGDVNGGDGVLLALEVGVERDTDIRCGREADPKLTAISAEAMGAGPGQLRGSRVAAAEPADDLFRHDDRRRSVSANERQKVPINSRQIRLSV